MNDITKDISSDICLFADDCILYRVIAMQVTEGIKVCIKLQNNFMESSLPQYSLY